MAENSTEDRQRDEDDTKREGRGATQAPEPKSGAKDSGEPAERGEPEAKGEAADKALDKPKAAAPEKKDGKPGVTPEPGLMTPTNVALMLAAAGLGAFWKGWSLYRTEGKDFYSASAWLFVIAFFLVTVSAFHFLSGQIARKPGEKGKSLMEALLPSLPFFALYAVVWWTAWDAWSTLYGPGGRSWMWMFFIALALASWGVWYALRPPSAEDVKADRLPTRRVVLLLMLPFVTVYGMIWMAERAITRR